jgi:transcription elongation factor GreA
MAERDAAEGGSIPITEEGLERLRAELDELKAKRQPEAADRIRDTREQAADPLESGEYAQALEELREVDARIAALEEMLHRVEVVETERQRGVISVGSTVKIRLDDGGRETYTLVGPAEADALSGRISHRSPLGRALIGRRQGQDVNWQSPEGPRSARILAVSAKPGGAAGKRRAG